MLTPATSSFSLLRCQGALDALKLSQELLLKLHRRSPSDGETNTINSPDDSAFSQPSNSIPASETPRGKATENDGSDAAHVQELAAQTSRLRRMSSGVKRLLLLATGEVQGALEDTMESVGLAATAADERTANGGGIPDPPALATVATVATVATQVGGHGADSLVEELRTIEAVARALEREKARLDVELGKAAGELASVRDLLTAKTAQVWPGSRYRVYRFFA